MSPNRIYVVKRVDVFSLGEETYRFETEKTALHFMYLMNTLGDSSAKYELSTEKNA